MTVVGVTGHSNITDSTADLVRGEIVKLLRSKGNDLIGITCLASGADQAFADALLEIGGSLSVVVPAFDYFANISDPAAAKRCQDYLAEAKSTIAMENEFSGPHAYFEASKYLIDNCDLLIAVWDGSAPTGGGGTADAVNYAREQGRPVTVIWPVGADRRS